MAIIFILAFYSDFLFTNISSIIVTLFNILSSKTPWFNIPLSAYGWFSAMVTIFIIIDAIVMAIPSRVSEWKSGWYNKTIGLTLGILVIIMVWGAVAPGDGLAQGSVIVADRVADNSKSGWESLMCTISPECLLKKQNEDKTEVVDTQKFSINMDGQKYRPYSFDEARSETIDLKYKIMTGETPIYLSQVVCRLGDDRGEVLSNVSLDNKEISNILERPESGIYCNIGNISIDKIKSSNLKLRVQLYYKAFTTLTQEVPLLRVDSKEEKDNLDYNNLDKGVKISTNDLISLDPQSSASNFEYPILFGDGAFIKDEYRFNFILKINNRYSSSGELLRTQINNISIPSIFTYSSQEYHFPYELSTNDGESNLRFKLKLAITDSEDDRSIQKIHFFTESSIVKKDTIYLEISDYEEQKQRAQEKDEPVDESAPQNSNEQEVVIADNTQTQFELVENS